MFKTEKCLPTLSIIIPCYNEEKIFNYCLTTIYELMNSLVGEEKISAESKIIFIDDGSSDNTWNLIKNAYNTFSNIQGVRLSRNKGHQLALLAGLSVAKTDITISIDADLQDDIKCIPKMIQQYKNGFDIVYGVRNDLSSDSIFKRFTANTFYSLMSKLGVEQIPNHADFRLLSRRALKTLLQYKEQNLYIRGIIPQLGYKSTKVYYARSERLAGESKYPLKKMLALALNGITSFSITPLRIVTFLGGGISLFSFLIILYSLCNYLLGNTISGWTSIIIMISFLSGIQLLCLGIIGEYIGKAYLESKQRPKFFIEEHLK